jgi:hypothetical protein
VAATVTMAVEMVAAVMEEETAAVIECSFL